MWYNELRSMEAEVSSNKLGLVLQSLAMFLISFFMCSDCVKWVSVLYIELKVLSVLDLSKVGL